VEEGDEVEKGLQDVLQRAQEEARIVGYLQIRKTGRWLAGLGAHPDAKLG